MLREFGDALLDAVRDAKGVDVEDVRAAMHANTTRPVATRPVATRSKSHKAN